jgi:hypothetical protein
MVIAPVPSFHYLGMAEWKKIQIYPPSVDQFSAGTNKSHQLVVTQSFAVVRSKPRSTHEPTIYGIACRQSLSPREPADRLCDSAACTRCVQWIYCVLVFEGLSTQYHFRYS